MVHDHQLLKDTQVQVCSLYIVQLSSNNHKNASHPAAVVATAVVIVGLYLLQLSEYSSHYKLLDRINNFQNKLLHDCHHFISCEEKNMSQKVSPISDRFHFYVPAGLNYNKKGPCTSSLWLLKSKCLLLQYRLVHNSVSVCPVSQTKLKPPACFYRPCSSPVCCHLGVVPCWISPSMSCRHLSLLRTGR